VHNVDGATVERLLEQVAAALELGAAEARREFGQV
jgi:hypothetical protein